MSNYLMNYAIKERHEFTRVAEPEWITNRFYTNSLCGICGKEKVFYYVYRVVTYVDGYTGRTSEAVICTKEECFEFYKLKHV